MFSLWVTSPQVLIYFPGKAKRKRWETWVSAQELSFIIIIIINNNDENEISFGDSPFIYYSYSSIGSNISLHRRSHNPNRWHLLRQGNYIKFNPNFIFSFFTLNITDPITYIYIYIYILIPIIFTYLCTERFRFGSFGNFIFSSSERIDLRLGPIFIVCFSMCVLLV